MTLNPTTFRFPSELTGTSPEELARAITLHSNGLLDLNQAIAALKAQVDTNKASAAAAVEAVNETINSTTASTSTVSPYTIVNTTTSILVAPWNIVLVDTTSGAITITLPPAATSGATEIIVKKISSDTNAVAITPSGSDTIESQPSVSIPLVNQSLTFISDGVSNSSIN